MVCFKFFAWQFTNSGRVPFRERFGSISGQCLSSGFPASRSSEHQFVGRREYDARHASRGTRSHRRSNAGRHSYGHNYKSASHCHSNANCLVHSDNCFYAIGDSDGVADGYRNRDSNPNCVNDPYRDSHCHDHSKSDCNFHWHGHRDRYSNGNSDGYCNRNADRYCNCVSDPYRDSHCHDHSNSDCNFHWHGHRDRYSNGNSDGYCNRNADRYCNCVSDPYRDSHCHDHSNSYFYSYCNLYPDCDRDC